MDRRDVAIVTPSYTADLERCRLLCDSIDAHVDNFARHYILVANHDAPPFAQFEGPRRVVIRESDLLPERFVCVNMPVIGRAWLSTFAPPLRGWHLQQLRRIAIATVTDHAGYLYCDSDMAFVRGFDVADLWHGDAFRLYRRKDGIHEGLPDGGRLHMAWTRHAHALLGLAEPVFPESDYINNLVSWRRDEVLAMIERIEMVTGKAWLRAVTARRRFSECQIYGAQADRRERAHLHRPDASPLCLTRWGGKAMDADDLEAFIETMSPSQVAVGIQSFTGTDPSILRRALRL